MTSFTPPVEIGAWLACIAFMLWIFNLASRAWFTLRGKPSPEEQQAVTNGIASRVASIERCIGACKQEQDRRLDEIEKGQHAMRELIDEKIGDVFERVKETAEDTNVMRGELRGIKSNLDLLLSRSLTKR
jgi:hypothetical protein